MKKLIAVLSAAAMTLSLAACGSTATVSSAASSGEAASSAETADAPHYKIAIVQQLDHSSLDEIRTAVEAQLEARAAADGFTVEYTEYNGQNDASTLNQIGTQVVDGGFNAVVPIATLAAQTMVTATEGLNMPVVYAAISDPEAAGLTDLPLVTGTSDALNTPFILDMMLAVNPDIQTVGLLYSNSETNSATPIAEAKAYLDEKGIAYVEKTGNTNDEILSAVAALSTRWTPSLPPPITWSWPPLPPCPSSSPPRAYPSTPARTPSSTRALLPPAASTTRSWAPTPPICWWTSSPPGRCRSSM